MSDLLVLSFKRSFRRNGTLRVRSSCADVVLEVVGHCRCFDCQTQLERSLICETCEALERAGYAPETVLHWQSFDGEVFDVDLGFLMEAEELGEEGR